MKKLFLIVLACGMLVSAAACSSNTAAPPEGQASSIAVSEETPVPTAEPTPVPTAAPTAAPTPIATSYFKDNVFVTPSLKIEITEYKVIQPGEAGNEYGISPVIAFWYNTTNLTDNAVNPTTAWMTNFTAAQDNDSNMVNNLLIGMLPDSSFLESQIATIKKDGTVQNAVAYNLSDTTTPVKLTAKIGLIGDTLGEQTYDLQ